MLTMFEELGFISKFNMDINSLKFFLHLVCLNYNFAPFHNMTHCFNVTHVLYWIINPSTGDGYLSNIAFDPIDKLALILAAIGHDLNHPGLSNSYLSKSKHMISKTVNGQSILENFHCFTLFNLFDQTKLLNCLD